MVDIEQRTLRALEQQVFARGRRPVEFGGHVGHHRRQARRESERLVMDLLKIDRLRLEVVLQHEVVEIEHLAQLLGKALRIGEVLQADGAPRHLVLVGGAYAPARGADLVRALGRLARLVDGHVIRQDQGTGAGDAQPVGDRDPGRFELVDLLQNGRRGQHHTVADVAGNALAQDAGGNQPQYRLLAVDHQRMAGVVPALKAHYAIGMVGEPIDDLALALVTPLGADHYHVLCHTRSKKRELRAYCNQFDRC